jgi:hypothetical protein
MKIEWMGLLEFSAEARRANPGCAGLGPGFSVTFFKPARLKGWFGEFFPHASRNMK